MILENMSEEKHILKICENTAGIYGDLQGLIGNALPKVQYLELPEGDKGKRQNNKE